VDEIVHPLIREVFRKLEFNLDVEVGSFADVPATGTGLGSSSSFTVGLINSLSNFCGNRFSKRQLAELACEIELERCKEPIGKQDQYAAAFGGINSFTFHTDGTVSVFPVSDDGVHNMLNSSLILYDLGYGRKSSDILRNQSIAMLKAESFNKVKKLRELVSPMILALETKNISLVADVIRESWEYKKEITEGISNASIAELHEIALQKGALAGKVVGAGGGGFLLLVVEPEKREWFKKSFKLLSELKFEVSQTGSEIVLNDELT